MYILILKNYFYKKKIIMIITQYLMKKALLLILFATLFSPVFSQWIPADVPDPKKTNDGYVCNPDIILSNYTVDSLNRQIKNADDSGYIQVAVVALNSIGNAVPKEFATELFNLWEIGHKGADNGLLVLLVLDQRRVEFETGYGIETYLTDAECYTIQQDFMVKHFKDENYDLGILKGVNAAIGEASTNSFLDQYTNEYIQDGTPYDYDKDYYYDGELSFFDIFFHSSVGMLYFAIVGFLFTAFIIILFISFFLKDRYHRYQAMRIFSLPIIPIFFPLPFLPLFFLVKYLIKTWRETPRISKTGQKMHILNENEDDEFLSKGQIKEEHVKSVDYDVWVTSDHEETLILAYKRWFSKYSQCPKCKFKTYHQLYNKVIRPATYSSSGIGEKKYKCVNCGKSVTRKYTIPKKQKSSTSSSSYSSWGGGGSSYSSGSSYSGGSSWGGGSSGGGGAGSSW